MAIQCEICGCTNITKQGGVFVCQKCGAQYTAEALREMMSGEVPQTAPSPAPSGEPAKKADISALLDSAEQEMKAGNLDAAKTYLSHAEKQAPDNFEVLYRMIDYGFGGDLKRLVELAPDDRKEEILDYAYRRLEKPCIEFSPTMLYKFYPPSIYNFMGETLPNIKIQGFWDETRYRISFIKSIITAINLYKLPEALPDGFFADAHLALCCQSVEGIDRLISELEPVIPDVCRVDIHEAFSRLCDRITGAKWYTNNYKNHSAVIINSSETMYYPYLQQIKKLGAKHQNVVQTLKAKVEEERKATQKAAQKAYWDAHPEELKAKKEAEKQSKLKKLQSKLENVDLELADMNTKKHENDETLDRIAKERASLGLFKGKLKKQLEDQWTELYAVQLNLGYEIDLKEQERSELVEKLGALQREIDGIHD